MKTGAELIAEERSTHEAMGWTPTLDDGHDHQELLKAALAYALTEVNDASYADAAIAEWPWDLDQFKNGGENPRVTNLIKAGALLAAEIDRIQRLLVNRLNV